jgi:hypothetical protein
MKYNKYQIAKWPPFATQAQWTRLTGYCRATLTAWEKSGRLAPAVSWDSKWKVYSKESILDALRITGEGRPKKAEAVK